MLCSMIKLREFPSLDLFFFARSRLLSHMRSDDPPSKIFAAKKELQIYNYGKSLFERLKCTTSWGSLGQKATIFVLAYLSLVKFECKQRICNDGRERYRTEGELNDYSCGTVQK